MDAFESIIGRILEKKGYWVRQSVKVELTPTEKQQMNNPFMPTPEIDLVAMKGNECLLLEVKSFLDSDGVRLFGVNGSNQKDAKKYKIINNTVFQTMMESKIRNAFDLPSTTKVIFGLAAGNIYPQDLQGIENYCKTNGYFLMLPSEIADALVKLGGEVYINDEVTMTIKMLRNENRLK